MKFEKSGNSSSAIFSICLAPKAVTVRGASNKASSLLRDVTMISSSVAPSPSAAKVAGAIPATAAILPAIAIRNSIFFPLKLIMLIPPQVIRIRNFNFSYLSILVLTRDNSLDNLNQVYVSIMGIHSG